MSRPFPPAILRRWLTPSSRRPSTKPSAFAPSQRCSTVRPASLQRPAAVTGPRSCVGSRSSSRLLRYVWRGDWLCGVEQPTEGPRGLVAGAAMAAKISSFAAVAARGFRLHDSFRRRLRVRSPLSPDAFGKARGGAGPPSRRLSEISCVGHHRAGVQEEDRAWRDKPAKYDGSVTGCWRGRSRPRCSPTAVCSTL